MDIAYPQKRSENLPLAKHPAEHIITIPGLMILIVWRGMVKTAFRKGHKQWALSLPMRWDCLI